MKLMTVVGARPQFVKASIVSRAIQSKPNLEEIVIHTGQHFDANMSDVFFSELNIPSPKYRLDINGGGHGEMTGKMLIEIEKILLDERPDRLMVYGDTNSTLAGAVAASKLHIPVAHVEAGLRSFNMKMPEEINRILTDQVSDILFTPTLQAVENLKAEGFSNKAVDVLNVGDVMQDSALFFEERSVRPDGVNVDNDFILATLHRAENTDSRGNMSSIVQALNELHSSVAPVVLPLHPRTKKKINDLGLVLKVITVDPVGYLEMLWLLSRCRLVLTDSGGVQKEAFFFRKPCVTMREQTEWVELVDCGVNQLAGSDYDKILGCVEKALALEVNDDLALYGGGEASERIANYLNDLS